MRRANRLLPLLAVLAIVLASPRLARAGDAPTGPVLSGDPLLRDLVAAALERRPELAQARGQTTALRERVPQSRVLADPTLALGIQNDGFSGIQVGKMPMSWYYIVASQTLPWPGKRGLRGEVAGFDVRGAEAEVRRALLTVTAEVERAYVDLLLVRGQLVLLERLESLWKQAEIVSRARYEAGEGAQSDLLRAQLEKNRLRQKRLALVSEERRRVTVLNRLSGRPMHEGIASDVALARLADPGVPDVEQAVAAALAESPELERARLLGEQADRRVELAKRERWPDVTVSAGVMPRGSLETMWQAGVALNIPVWSAARQGKVMAENRARGQAARNGADAIRLLVEQRVRERVEAMRALVEINRLYRSGLLVQSEATVSTNLVQYQVGRVTFASVLEALSGHLADVNGFLESVAAVERIAIANRELSLDSPESASATGMAAGGVPGAGAAGAAISGARQPGEETASPSAGSSMSRM